MDSPHEPQLEEVLEFVLKRFGDGNGLIEPQFHRSETFRALCDDYALCAAAMERWQSSDAAIAAQRADEYAKWLTELETEIHDWLEREQSESRGAPEVDE